MTNKVELNTLTQVVHKEQAFLTALNENFLRLQQAINDTLSRSGVVPNQMEEVLDMNGKRIINVGPAIEDTDALTRGYIEGLIGEIEDAIARLGELTNQAIEAVQLYYTENIYPSMAAAVTEAQTASGHAETWAEGSDAQVEALGGEHSAKRWAEISEQTVEGLIPDQTGHAGEFLSTDGTDLSWKEAASVVVRRFE